MNKKIMAVFIIIIILVMVGFYFLKQASQNTEVSSTQNSENSLGKVSITISNFAFNPKAVTINKGDTITWINNDFIPHQLASNSLSALHSDIMNDKQTYSFTFNESGTFDYHCVIHPMMKGSISVK